MNKLNYSYPIFGFFFFLLTLNLNAAKIPNYITKEALKETKYLQDPEANAAVLFENKDVYYNYNSVDGFVVVTEFKRVVKVYKKKGLSYGLFKIRLSKSGSLEENVSKIKGYTYSIKNDEIVAHKLTKENIFKEETSKHVNTISVSLPEVVEGVIVEISYTKTSPFNISLPSLYIQEYIPVILKTAKITIPEYYIFNTQSRGGNQINFKQSTSSNSFAYRSSTTGETHQIDYTSNVYHIKAQNVEAIKTEPYVDNILNYTSTVQFFLKSIEYPYSPITNYAYTWTDVLNKIVKKSSFKKELEKKNYYKNELRKILSTTPSKNEKIKQIYEFVKNKIKWNKEYTPTAYGGVTKAFEKNIGNSGQINMVLLSMLKNAGFKVRPIFITTQDKRKDLFPNYNAFNHFIVEITNDDISKTYLDATYKKGIPNILSQDVLKGKAMFLSTAGKAVNLNIKPKKISEEITLLNYQINSDHTINGNCNAIFKDYKAMNYRRNNKKNIEKLITQKKEQNILDSVTNVKRENYKDLYTPIKESFDFQDSKQITSIDNEIYFNPLIFTQKKNNPFKQNTRKYPLNFSYPINERKLITITIPEGYKPLELPKKMSLSIPNKASFIYNSTYSNGKLQLMINLKMQETFYSVTDYPFLKQFIDQVYNKQSEQIVLVKE